MKTSELTRHALDWAVHVALHGSCTGHAEHEYSANWAQGGPIIEREGIDVHRVNSELWSAKWWANNSGMAKNPAQRFKQNIQTDGPTPLIAAMRCYVASRLGDDVDVPELP